MLINRILLKAFWALLVIGVIFVFGVVAGWFVNEELDKENSLLSRAERKVSAYTRAILFEGAEQAKSVSTGRLRLKKQVVNVPLAVTDSGGGLGLAPERELLLLDRTGGIFSVMDDKVTKLVVTPPPNGRVQLQRQLDDGEFAGTQVRFRGFRYTDILYHAEGGTQHLLIAYTEWFPDKRCFTNTLAKADLGADQSVASWKVAAEDWEIIKRAVPCIPLRKGGGRHGRG